MTNRPPSFLARLVGVVTHPTVVTLSKYLLAVVLLTGVIWSQWSPPDGKGLGYVWQRHVVQGEPVAWHFFWTAVGLFTAAMLVTLTRWYILVRAVGLEIHLREALRVGMIGVFFNAFLPGSVGGDIVKAAVLARGQSRRTVAVATVIMDRLIALWALVWFVAISGGVFWAAGWLDGNAKTTSVAVIGGAVAVVAVSLTAWLVLGLLPEERAERFAGRLARLRRVGGSAAEFWRAVWTYRCRQKAVAAVMALSWVGHVGFVLAFFCCANALWSEELGEVPTLAQHFLLVPMGLVFQAVIPTPGGAGAGEVGFGGLYKLFGASAANGVLASLVQRVIGWMLGLVGCVVFLRSRAALPDPLDASAGVAEAEVELAAEGAG